MTRAGEKALNSRLGELQVLGGSASSALTDDICAYLGISRGRATSSRFPDGETLIKLEDDVRGKDCFVVQSTCPPVNDNLMELLIFIDSLRRASAQRITAVIPYYGYARQDRKAEGRTPITAKLVANMLVEAGVDRVLTMNLHAAQIQGFFDIPVDHLTAAPALARYCITRDIKDAVFVSPDVGNIKFGNDFAARIGAELAVIHKRRLSGERTVAVSLVGNVEGKTVMMFDDMITTAGTVSEATKLVRDHGAKSVYVGATHGLFVGPALPRDGFLPKLEAWRAALTPQTRALVINYPANPTGAIPPRAYLQSLLDFAADNHLWVISDEVYENLYFDEKPVSAGTFPEHRDHVILVNSLSKTYAMTGWRIGYLAAPNPVVENALKASQNSITCVAPFIQEAAVFALTDETVQAQADAMRADYARRRALVMRIYAEYPNSPVVVTPPQGAFYFFLDMRALEMSSQDIFEQLLDQAGVGVVPGTAFGPGGAGFVRMTIAASDEDVSAGFRAILEWAQKKKEQA